MNEYIYIYCVTLSESIIHMILMSYDPLDGFGMASFSSRRKDIPKLIGAGGFEKRQLLRLPSRFLVGTKHEAILGAQQHFLVLGCSREQRVEEPHCRDPQESLKRGFPRWRLNREPPMVFPVKNHHFSSCLCDFGVPHFHKNTHTLRSSYHPSS
jgi:hypothetical protein